MQTSLQTRASQHDRLEPVDLLFVGYGDWHLWRWDGFRTRSAQLCRFLARSSLVRRLYVLNEPIYLRGSAHGLNVPRKERFMALPPTSRCSHVEENIFALDPSRFLLAPFRLRKGYVARMIQRHLTGNGVVPVLWVANVPMAFLMERVRCRLRIFDAIDDWEHIPALGPHLAIRECYETLAARADIIFTVSEYLAAKFERKAPAALVRHVPNGVDLELFRRPADPPRARRRMRKGKEPVLTYVGVLSSRFDAELTAALSRAFPHSRILLVGPMHTREDPRLTCLRGLPNVELKGLVHHRYIPEILRESDVLLIPHRRSTLALSMDPLKLYEYLTTGLPIVATDVPPVRTYEALVYIAHDAASFVEKVEEALAEQETPRAEDLWRARIEEAQRHSWEHRVETILEAVRSRLWERAPER